MMIVLAGLPEPTVALRINYPDGTLRYRLDLSYPELKLAVEYDGRQHADDTTQWEGDVERDYWFENNGWMKVKVLAAGVFKRPERTLMRIRGGLAQAGRAGAAAAADRVAAVLPGARLRRGAACVVRGDARQRARCAILAPGGCVGASPPALCAILAPGGCGAAGVVPGPGGEAQLSAEPCFHSANDSFQSP
jgi:hypothetical protein